MNKTVVYAGLITLIQASVQVVMTAMAIAQYFCVIDFLRELPILLFIKILYYHNSASCGSMINIGHAIDEISNQAVVLITRESLTVTRTLYVNACSLVLGSIWCLGSAVMMRSGQNNDRVMVWPWVVTTVAVCVLDLIATVIFINDTFYTRTLSDVMDYIGATASGVRNTVIDTRIAAWSMAVLYSRFGIIFFVNVVLIVIVVLNRISNKPLPKRLEPDEAVAPADEVVTTLSSSTVSVDLNTPSLPSDQKIPRAWYNRNKMMFFENQSRLTMESVPQTEAIYSDRVFAQPNRSITKEEQRIPEEQSHTPFESEPFGSSGLKGDGEPQPSTSRQAEFPAQLPWTYIPVTSQPVPSKPNEPPPSPESSLIKKRKAAILSSLSSLTSITQKKNTTAPTATPTFKSSIGACGQPDVK